MPAYQPYLVAPFETGRYLSRASWLAPADAFTTLSNARVNKGVLEKRPGIELLATTGRNHPIMGLFEYRYRGAPRCLVFDTRRAYKLDFADHTLADLCGADTFTGGEHNYFRFASYGNYGYFTNGTSADGLYKYDAFSNAFTKLPLAANLGLKSAGARMIFQFPAKNRLILVGTLEDGTYYLSRLRYSNIDSDTFDALHYVDGRFDDPPVCGAALGKELLIFCERSVWRIRYTGDTDNPFTWEPVTDSQGYGSVTPYVCAQTDKALLTINEAHIILCDGYEAAELDLPRVRDVRAEMESSRLDRAYGCALTADRHIYIAYPPTGENHNTRILDYNVLERNWATYQSEIVFHCLGALGSRQTPKFTQADNGYGGALVSDMDIAALDPLRAGRAFTLAGDRTGHVYQLDSGTSDNGASVVMDVRTAQLNPYVKEGRRVRLGYLDVLVDSDPAASATVRFYKDNGTTDYKALTLSCEGDGATHWVRLNLGGELGRCHEMRIYNDAPANRPRIHALDFWFAPGGRLT